MVRRPRNSCRSCLGGRLQRGATEIDRCVFKQLAGLAPRICTDATQMNFPVCENPCSSVANLLSLRIFGASNRAVVQLGRTLEWGSRGRGFESRRPERVLTTDYTHEHRLSVA